MESSGRTLVCSVLFPRHRRVLEETGRRPAATKAGLQRRARARAGGSCAARPIILDTGDGAAITFLGDPEDALFASISMRDAAAVLGVRAGVNLGPVRLVKDLNGRSTSSATASTSRSA
jgi:hypothetical protein